MSVPSYPPEIFKYLKEGMDFETPVTLAAIRLCYSSPCPLKEMRLISSICCVISHQISLLASRTTAAASAIPAQPRTSVLTEFLNT